MGPLQTEFATDVKKTPMGPPKSQKSPKSQRKQPTFSFQQVVVEKRVQSKTYKLIKNNPFMMKLVHAILIWKTFPVCNQNIIKYIEYQAGQHIYWNDIVDEINEFKLMYIPQSYHQKICKQREQMTKINKYYQQQLDKAEDMALGNTNESMENHKYRRRLFKNKKDYVANRNAKLQAFIERYGPTQIYCKFVWKMTDPMMEIKLINIEGEEEWERQDMINNVTSMIRTKESTKFKKFIKPMLETLVYDHLMTIRRTPASAKRRELHFGWTLSLKQEGLGWLIFGMIQSIQKAGKYPAGFAFEAWFNKDMYEEYNHSKQHSQAPQHQPFNNANQLRENKQKYISHLRAHKKRYYNLPFDPVIPPYHERRLPPTPQPPSPHPAPPPYHERRPPPTPTPPPTSPHNYTQYIPHNQQQYTPNNQPQYAQDIRQKQYAQDIRQQQPKYMAQPNYRHNIHRQQNDPQQRSNWTQMSQNMLNNLQQMIGQYRHYRLETNSHSEDSETKYDDSQIIKGIQNMLQQIEKTMELSYNKTTANRLYAQYHRENEWINILLNEWCDDYSLRRKSF